MLRNLRKRNNLPVVELTPPSARTTSDKTAAERTPPADGFVAGSLFGDRFRIITWLGHSESGEVWQAEDLVLQTPVALKIMRSADAAERERMLSEVRLARQIAHPAIRRIFDVGEAEGKAYCSMELVEGESLAVLLRRVGRLLPEKVFEIAVHLCGALAAAHAHGVLHRDLRPENVLIDQYGFVRITDFGVAATLEANVSQGPARYLAPELRERPGFHTEKTDIYALGAMLYELLIGQPPAQGRPERPSAVVPDVPEPLERALLHALHRNPSHRTESAAAMGTELSADVPVAPPRSRFSSWAIGGAVAAVGVAAAAMLMIGFGGRTPVPAALSDQDSIVVADFVNTTGEPVFDGALKVALVVALEQSPFMKVLPEERVRDALRLMQRPADGPITRTIARDVARREQAKALLAGSIERLGTNYVLALEAVNTETGDVMAREQAEVAQKEDVLESLGAAASRLRAKLGESLALVQRFDVPLPRATTPSLEALHAYALGLDQGRLNPRVEAIPHLQRAIDLDPDFAMAHALLSGVYANTGRSTDAPRHARAAFELRDRVSERERFFISWRYYVDATQDWAAAVKLAESWTTTYPREAFAFNSLGLASATFGDRARAAAAFREAIRIDPRFVPPYGNLATSLVTLGEFAQAQSAIDQAARRGIETTGIRRATFLLTWMGHRTGAVPTDDVWTPTWEARAAAAAGRFAVASSLYARAIEKARIARLTDFASQWTLEDAELYALAGRCDLARRRVAAGIALGGHNVTLERAARILSLCGDAQGSTRLSAQLRQQFPEATLTIGLHVPVAAAALSFSRRENSRVLELLEPVRAFDHAPSAEFWPKYLRAETYRRLTNARDAIGAFRQITEHQGEAPNSPLFALAHLGLARTLMSNGESEPAQRAYERFFALWREADANLPALAEARREYPRVQ